MWFGSGLRVQALDDITRLLDAEALDTHRCAAPERTLVGFSRVAIEHALESEQLTAEQRRYGTNSARN